MNTSLSITASYAFVDLDQTRLKSLKQELLTFGRERQMQGLVLIAPEGINATVAGSAQAIGEWKNFLMNTFGEMIFKDSHANGEVFRRWSVKIKPEIVAIKDERIQPRASHHHLSPAEWEKIISQEDVVVLDARNEYEINIGAFAGAIKPPIKHFHEFPSFVKRSGIAKDKKILMYCTGGIRCEKAIVAMENEGYQNVYQLEGGILAYLAQFPESKFVGECFVFDHRTAVDQYLRPSQTYGLRPHCGDPGDTMIHCKCGRENKICRVCTAEKAVIHVQNAVGMRF